MVITCEISNSIRLFFFVQMEVDVAPTVATIALASTVLDVDALDVLDVALLLLLADCFLFTMLQFSTRKGLNDYNG